MDCVLPRSAVKFFDPKGQYRDVVHNSTAMNRSNLGTFGMLRRIFTQEGVSGIYSGLTPTLVMSVPNTVLYFTSYDEIVSRLRTRLDSDAAWIPLVSGAMARLVASTATAPLELIRTRQASLIGESKSAPGLWGEFRIICRTEGIGSLFTGLAPTLWRDVPFSAKFGSNVMVMAQDPHRGLRPSPLSMEQQPVRLQVASPHQWMLSRREDKLLN